jgi:CRP-like cAMP-binding protein
MKTIKQTLIPLFDLTEEEADIFLSAFVRTEMKKKEVFVKEGKVCHKVGLIEKGLMLCVYQKDGNEIIDEFAFENSFITNYYSFLTHTPSTKEIRCLEDTVLHVVSRESLNDMAEKHPFIARMSRMINEKLFLRAHERISSLLLDSAHERYMKLIAQRPDLTQRLPQYLIASYLNLKPETISRIRKKISDQ